MEMRLCIYGFMALYKYFIITIIIIIIIIIIMDATSL